MVQDAQTYAGWGKILSNKCPFCDTSMNYGCDGLGERTCPNCQPLYNEELADKGLPPRIRETRTPFGFVRWAILKRAEADSAEAGWPFEKREQLVDDIIAIWVRARVSAQRTLQAEQAAADARRAAIASRSTY